MISRLGVVVGWSLLWLTGVVSSAFGQSPVSINPTRFGVDDTITIRFDARLGNRGLVGEQGDVFLYAGLLTSASTSPTDWQAVTPSNWNSYPATSRLTRIAPDIYQIRLRIRDYFSFAPSTQVNSFMLLFRNSTGTRVGREGGDADVKMDLNSRMSWWNETSFYEIFVRSFQDRNGDGIGDFDGITSRIPYLQQMGVKALWLMPIHPSPTYHGYDVTQYQEVNSQYGTKAAFKRMVDSLHAKDIKVVIDWVINHCSNQHPWFVAASQGDPHFMQFFRWSDTLPTNNLGPWGQNVWHLNPANNKYYYGLFWSGMPDLNYDYAPLRDSMMQAARYWVQDMDVDGFRLDAVMYLYERGDSLKNVRATLDYLQSFNQQLKAWKPSFYTVGEVWDNTDIIRLYNDRLDNCFEFNLAALNLQAAATTVVSENLRSYIPAATYTFYPQQQFATFITNHDQNRIFSQVGSDINRCRAAAGLYLTQPGVPYLYYGEEYGMAGQGIDEDKRLPMAWTNGRNAGFTTGTPWRNPDRGYVTRNVLSQINDSASLLTTYRRLIRLRNLLPSLRKGDVSIRSTNRSTVLAQLRSYANEWSLVLTNTSSLEQRDIIVRTGISGLNQRNGLTWLNLMDSSVYAYPLDSAFTNFDAIKGIALAPGETKILKASQLPITASQPIADHSLSIDVWPNPVREGVNIKLPTSSDNQALVTITDMMGRSFPLAVEKKDSQFQATMTAFPAGVYLLKVESQGKIFTTKLTKI